MTGNGGDAVHDNVDSDSGDGGGDDNGDGSVLTVMTMMMMMVTGSDTFIIVNCTSSPSACSW